MRNNKKYIVLSIVSISLIMLILIGLTYAYYLSNVQGNSNSKSINVDTKYLSLTYGDGDSSIITATRIEPGTTIGTKTFTVTNTGNAENDYLIILENVSITYVMTVGDQVQGAPTSFESNDFVYTITCSSSDNINCEQVTSETSLPLYNNGIIVTNEIAAGTTHTYTITVKYLETGVDQSADMNKALSARINVADLNSINPYISNSNSLAYNMINNAMLKKNGTELTRKARGDLTAGSSQPGTFYSYLEKEQPISTSSLCGVVETGGETEGYEAWLVYDTEEGSSSTSVSSYSDAVGKWVLDQCAAGAWGEEDWPKRLDSYDSTTNKLVFSHRVYGYEKTVTITNDDLGLSYYYRGNVLDNYVNFANMCWRIVRIEGDGSIKLILEDQDQTCANSNGNWDIPTTTGGNTKVGNFGYDNTTYSGKTIANYLNPTSDSVAGAQVTAFKNFQTGPLASYLNKLKSGDWCYDDKAYLQNGSNPNYTYNEITDKNIYYSNNQNFVYDSYVRLYEGSSINPTLRCNGTIMNKYGDNSDMYVATLTADELVYAGLSGFPDASYDLGNYLMNNYFLNNIYNWLTLSPAIYDNQLKIDYAYYYTTGEGLNRQPIGNYIYDGNEYEQSAHFRPVIRLRNGTTISGGDGTKNNPYVIN